jgi:hypothetical protein
MHTDFPPERKGNMFVAKFSGYEQTEDESDKAKALSTYTSAGILGLSNAAKLADLPEDPDAVHIGRVLITPNGPIFLDDVADPAIRAAHMKAQMAKLQMSNDNETQKESDNNITTNEKHAKNNMQSNMPKSQKKDETSSSKGSLQPKDANKSDRGDARTDKKPVNRIAYLLDEAKNEPQERMRADYRRWREIALKDIKQNKPIRRFVSELIPDEMHRQLSDALERCTTADEVRDVFRSAQDLELTRARWNAKWRSPSCTQVSLEATLANAIEAFVLKTEMSNNVPIVPGEQARAVLLDIIQSVLISAIHEGKRIATGTEDRSLISSAKNVAGRAVQLISDIVSHIKEKVQSIIDSLSSTNEVKDVDIDHDLKEWAEGYADRLAGDEVHCFVEEGVLDGMKRSGVTQE